MSCLCLLGVWLGCFWIGPQTSHAVCCDAVNSVGEDAWGSGFECGPLGHTLSQGSLMEKISLACNCVTCSALVTLYCLEFLRERWCLSELDISEPPRPIMHRSFGQVMSRTI